VAKGRSGSGGTGKVLLGFVLGILVVVVGVYAYFQWGSPPVATADKPFPFEKAIVSVPLNARIQKQVQKPPFGVDEDVYEGGAKVYREQCAACHGTPGKDVKFAAHM
jgi:thiosulfate dehydrogenase